MFLTQPPKPIKGTTYGSSGITRRCRNENTLERSLDSEFVVGYTVESGATGKTQRRQVRFSLQPHCKL